MLIKLRSRKEMPANKTNTGLPCGKSRVGSYFGRVGCGKDFMLPLGLLKKHPL